ncbi:alpha/beta fold hydrolase [Streptomyces sp. BBFR2]|uniref:alpha/beta fold hydrolase n=1 Tax=Streptomyces sp. BBFR2 TaxID=3372854 RepID=UPI0037D99425
MRHAAVTPAGDRIRWIEHPDDGTERPARLYLHGLGASSPVYWSATAAHPLLTGARALLLDLLGFGISDRPAAFAYTMEAHADAVAAALEAAEVEGAQVVAHSMGGTVAVLLAARHPRLVSRLVLVDPNLDALEPERGAGGSRGIAARTAGEFAAGDAETAAAAGSEWWATMRLAGRDALHRSAVELVRGSTPSVRETLCALTVPRTLLYPTDDGPFPGADGLTAAGVTVVGLPGCGHNMMLDAPEAFARATAEALA